jgi:hypothetical protein
MDAWEDPFFHRLACVPLAHLGFIVDFLASLVLLCMLDMSYVLCGLGRRAGRGLGTSGGFAILVNVRHEYPWVPTDQAHGRPRQVGPAY